MPLAVTHAERAWVENTADSCTEYKRNRTELFCRDRPTESDRRNVDRPFRTDVLLQRPSYRPHYAFCLSQAVTYSKNNKKSELMLTWRLRAYSSFCLQVVLVHAHPFRCNSLFCSRTSQKNHKSRYFWGSSHSRSSMLIPLKSTSVVLVISSMSVRTCICKRFHARQANSKKITILRVLLFDTRVHRPR